MSKRTQKQKQKQKKKRVFKSGLEKQFAQKLLSLGIPCQYETDRFKYQILSSYTPDFKIRDGYYVETKGYFSPSNRGRLLAFREQYPDITIHLVFQAPNNYLSKSSSTTYAKWAEMHGFRWSSMKDINGQTFDNSRCSV